MKNQLIVLSGPSGVGKGTIVKKLMERGGYALSVSCTTRKKRRGEKDGVSYFFISKTKFKAMIEEGGFLEYNNHFKNFYGTPKAFVEKQLETHDVILEIEVDGALNVKNAYPEALLIMILPPSVEELKARLLKRGSEDGESIEERLKRMDYELSKQSFYDCTVINDDLETAVDEIDNIIKSRKNFA